MPVPASSSSIPVTAYLGDVNSHRDSDVRGALAPLAAAAEEAGVAVVMIRHLNKGVGGSALYRRRREHRL